jgi:hypothetical protein
MKDPTVRAVKIAIRAKPSNVVMSICKSSARIGLYRKSLFCQCKNSGAGERTRSGVDYFYSCFTP